MRAFRLTGLFLTFPTLMAIWMINDRESRLKNWVSASPALIQLLNHFEGLKTQGEGAIRHSSSKELGSRRGLGSEKPNTVQIEGQTFEVNSKKVYEVNGVRTFYSRGTSSSSSAPRVDPPFNGASDRSKKVDPEGLMQNLNKARSNIEESNRALEELAR